MIRFLLAAALMALAACTDPTLSTELVFGTGGMSVNPTLSGELGGATVSVQSN